MNTEIAKILVVDDDPTNRLKMEMSVRRLGYDPTTVESGREALNILVNKSFDIVLLDIIMPEMDGFEVLAQMKSDPRLRDIPVVVISTLEKMDAVAKAIEMGAEDHLPKTFDPILLKARISACLEKKRTRDVEVQYLQQVELLTKAATVLEKGKYNPSFLGIDGVMQRSDSLGKLARVFSNMASEVYERERRLNQKVRNLKGILLLLVTGGVLGTSVPLSRMAAKMSDDSFGLALWVLFFTAVFGISSAAIRQKLPRITPSALKFLFIWGVLTAVPQTLFFYVGAHLQGSLLAMILVTEGFIVFSIAAVLKLEEPNAKRLIGLFAGFVGVAIIVFAGDQIGEIHSWVWIGIALIIPTFFASEDYLINTRLPKDWDAIAAVGYVSFVAMILLVPAAFLLGGGMSFSFEQPGELELIILLLSVRMIIGNVLLVLLIQMVGAVFGSQVGYIRTVSGIALSLSLLHETLPLIAWVALVIMLIGLFLVAPKAEEEVRPNLEANNNEILTANTTR